MEGGGEEESDSSNLMLFWFLLGQEGGGYQLRSRDILSVPSKVLINRSAAHHVYFPSVEGAKFECPMFSFDSAVDL